MSPTKHSTNHGNDTFLLPHVKFKFLHRYKP